MGRQRAVGPEIFLVRLPVFHGVLVEHRPDQGVRLRRPEIYFTFSDIKSLFKGTVFSIGNLGNPTRRRTAEDAGNLFAKQVDAPDPDDGNREETAARIYHTATDARNPRRPHYADVGMTASGCPRRWFCSVDTSRSENALQDRTSSSVEGIL